MSTLFAVSIGNRFHSLDYISVFGFIQARVDRADEYVSENTVRLYCPKGNLLCCKTGPGDAVSPSTRLLTGLRWHVMSKTVAISNKHSFGALHQHGNWFVIDLNLISDIY